MALQDMLDDVVSAKTARDLAASDLASAEDLVSQKTANANTCWADLQAAIAANVDVAQRAADYADALIEQHDAESLRDTRAGMLDSANDTLTAAISTIVTEMYTYIS